jgi:cold shock CspA family protein
MQTGKITKWNEERGFGFIRATGAPLSESDIFVHITALPDQRAPDRLDVAVSFEMAADAQGRPRAVAVNYLR